MMHILFAKIKILHRGKSSILYHANVIYLIMHKDLGREMAKFSSGHDLYRDSLYYHPVLYNPLKSKLQDLCKGLFLINN